MREEETLEQKLLYGFWCHCIQSAYLHDTKTESYYVLVSKFMEEEKFSSSLPCLAWPGLLATTTFINKLSYTSLYIYIL